VAAAATSVLAEKCGAGVDEEEALEMGLIVERAAL